MPKASRRARSPLGGKEDMGKLCMAIVLPAVILLCRCPATAQTAYRPTLLSVKGEYIHGGSKIIFPEDSVNSLAVVSLSLTRRAKTSESAAIFSRHGMSWP